MMEQQQRKRQKLANLPKVSATAATAYVKVVQNGNSAFGKSIILWTTNNTYLFNCPEGLSRLLGEYRAGIGRLENIFLTRSAWENSGGLPGLALTIEASGVSNFNVHGPPHVQNIIDAVRPYQDQQMRVGVTVKSYTAGHYEDAVLHVQYVPLFGTPSEVEQEEQQMDMEDVSSQGEDMPGLTVKETLKQDNNDSDSNDNQSDAHVAVSFLVSIKPKPQKISVQNCIQLNIPFGPFIGKLQNGEAITLANGTVITPEQVFDSTTPNAPDTFLVVDLPSQDFLAALKDNEFLWSESVKKTHLVVHFTEKEVYESPDYQSWLRSFSADTRHLVVNALAPYMQHSAGVNKHQTLLNKVHADVFPLLEYQRSADAPNSSLDGSIVLAEPMLTYWLRGKHRGTFLRPEVEVQTDATIAAGDAATEAENATEDAESELTDEATKAIENMHNNEFPVCSSGSRSYPEVLMLGTSSAVPSKYRNVTGIFVNISADSSAMFDCGEGTFGQLYNLLGADECARRLAKLKLIFLSHMHQDHYVGIFTVLLQRRRAMQQLGMEYTPPYILASAPLFWVCSLYSRLIQPLGHFSTSIKTLNPDAEMLQKAAEHADLKYILPVPVVHAMMPHGVVIETLCGHKIVYSGDTRPCSSLVDAGRDAHLLIHEATMEDFLQEDAMRKRHSTVGEALDVAGQMNAQTVLLTHFSSRYPKIPLITDRMCEPGVGIAFDNMRIALKDATKLHHLTPVLKMVFAEQQLYMEERTAGKQMAKEDEEYRDKLQEEQSSLAAVRGI